MRTTVPAGAALARPGCRYVSPTAPLAPVPAPPKQ
jgi:hypothetical protein